MGNYVGQCSVLIKSIKGRAGPTCRARGFQRMFFSRAGAELSVLCGRFFRVRDTTPLSALSEPTRLRNCQPTCGRGEKTRGVKANTDLLTRYHHLDNEQHDHTFIFSLWFEFGPRRDWISLVEPSVQGKWVWRW